ncbi:MAG: hypothetical protein IT385_16365 [Deltaproteobacteria bacterium]|nr:hypothetical protein [Deltaproteobacteria bacterium]
MSDATSATDVLAEASDDTLVTDESSAEVDADSVGCPSGCEVPPMCHRPGTCVDGVCQFPVANDGSGCDDGQRCTAIDTCHDAECSGGGVPVDSVNDFAVGVTSTGGVEVSDVVIDEARGEVLALLAFPSWELPETAVLNLGRDATGTEVVVTNVHDGAWRMLVAARFDLRGRPKGWIQLATGDSSLRGGAMGIGSNGDIVVSGRTEEPVNIGIDGDVIDDVLTGTAFMGRFSPDGSLRALHRLESSDDTAAFLLGADCHAVTFMKANELVRHVDTSGFERTAKGPEDMALSAWIVRIPDCAELATTERLLAPEQAGGQLVPEFSTFAAGHDRTPRMVIGHVGGLTIASPSDDEPRTISQGDGVSLIALDSSDGIDWTMAYADSAFGGAGVVFDIISRGPHTWFNAGAYGIATLTQSDGSVVSIPGNPTQSSDLLPRTLIGRLTDAGQLDALFVSGQAVKGQGIVSTMREGLSPSLRVVIGGSTEFPEFGSSADRIPLGEGGGTFVGAVEGSELVWGTRVVAPIDGSAWLSKTLLVRPVPGTHGAIVVGDLAVPAVIGSAATRTFDPGPHPGAFILRVNSADGVGCEAPR